MRTMIKLNYEKCNHLYVAENDIIYLGYKLELTKTDYQIIEVLVKSGSSPISAEQISIITILYHHFLLRITIVDKHIIFQEKA